ncbi:MAG: 50S ribosomal protein L23 [Planctomycetota bacterium]|nr:MAG: 50S ribosomal protein L23 [Planctomycetota bacterium]
MSRDAYAIVRKPRLTEKATALQERHNAYTFEVLRDATKIEIRQAVEQLFKVKVARVRTMRVKGKPKRLRTGWVRTPEYKKAIVTLAPGERIDVL